MHLLTLIGYRGTGKTSVAKYLAQRLGWDWVDADAEIEQQAGRTIAAIFATDGESAFRDLETEVIEQLTTRNDCVVAAGGGAVLRAENRRAMKRGQVVWLTASPETIYRRVASDPTTSERRPNLTNLGEMEEIIRVLEERTPIYQALADLVLPTDDDSPQEIAAKIANGMLA